MTGLEEMRIQYIEYISSFWRAQYWDHKSDWRENVARTASDDFDFCVEILRGNHDQRAKNALATKMPHEFNGISTNPPYTEDVDGNPAVHILQRSTPLKNKLVIAAGVIALLLLLFYAITSPCDGCRRSLLLERRGGWVYSVPTLWN